jgi:hypothetical protein
MATNGSPEQRSLDDFRRIYRGHRVLRTTQGLPGLRGNALWLTEPSVVGFNGVPIF